MVPIDINLFGFVYLKPMQAEHCPDWKQSREIEGPDAKMAASGLHPTFHREECLRFGPRAEKTAQLRHPYAVLIEL
jgi:hypothetical protein